MTSSEMTLMAASFLTLAISVFLWAGSVRKFDRLSFLVARLNRFIFEEDHVSIEGKANRKLDYLLSDIVHDIRKLNRNSKSANDSIEMILKSVFTGSILKSLVDDVELYNQAFGSGNLQKDSVQVNVANNSQIMVVYETDGKLLVNGIVVNDDINFSVNIPLKDLNDKVAELKRLQNKICPINPPIDNSK